MSVLQEYSDRLRWASEPDHEQAHAINKGWRGARGSIVAYFNSDDVYLPGAVGHAVAALEARPEAAAVYGEGYHVDEEGQILEQDRVAGRQALGQMPPQTPRVASSRERSDQRYLRGHRQLLYHDGVRRSMLGGLLVPCGVSVNLSPIGEAHDP